MRFNPVLLKTQPGLISAILTEIDTSHLQHDPHWGDNMLARIKIHDPILGTYIEQCGRRYGAQAALTGLFVYRIIESQLEANQMEELYNDEN